MVLETSIFNEIASLSEREEKMHEIGVYAESCEISWNIEFGWALNSRNIKLCSSCGRAGRP